MIGGALIFYQFGIEQIPTKLSNDLRRGTNKLVKSDSPSLTSDFFGPFEIERLRGDFFGPFEIERLRGDSERLEARLQHFEDIERLKARQRRFEALSHRDIIQALNNIDPRLTKQQRQGQEHMQHQPSAVSRNPSRTSYMASQSALPHHPTVPPEPDRKYAGDPEKGNWSHRSGQGEQYHQQQGQKYHQEKQEQQDLHDQGKQYHQQGQGSQKQKQEQRDQQPKQCQQEKAQHQGQQDQQKQQGLKDLERQGQKDQQLNQSQKDQLKHGQQEQQQDQQSKRRQKDQNRQQGYVPVSLDSNYKGFGACPEGLFGEHCELKCPAKCGLSSETVGHPCNRATGECFAGCVSGYHGLKCNYTCNGFCEGGLCNQHDGGCTSGCLSGYKQKSQTCEKLQDTGDREVTVSQLTLIICLFISNLFIIVLSLVGAQVFRRRCRKSGYCEDDLVTRGPMMTTTATTH